MIQLNNLDTNEVYVLNDFSFSNNYVALKAYENDVLINKNGSTDIRVLNIIIDNISDNDELTLIDKITTQYFTQIINEIPEYINCEISKTGFWEEFTPNRNIRLYVPNTLIQDAIVEDLDLSSFVGILNSLNTEYKIKLKKGIVIYLEELYEEHKLLLEQYPEIIIEYKPSNILNLNIQ